MFRAILDNEGNVIGTIYEPGDDNNNTIDPELWDWAQERADADAVGVYRTRTSTFPGWRRILETTVAMIVLISLFIGTLVGIPSFVWFVLTATGVE